MLYSIIHQNDSTESLEARLKYLDNEIQILRSEARAIEGILDQRSSDSFRETMKEHYENYSCIK